MKPICFESLPQMRQEFDFKLLGISSEIYGTALMVIIDTSMVGKLKNRHIQNNIFLDSFFYSILF